jgi:hypothetical protein
MVSADNRLRTYLMLGDARIKFKLKTDLVVCFYLFDVRSIKRQA